MEIHHSRHERRGWRGFFAEFFMIAVAVFVGSMGEYYREHRVMFERRDESLVLMLRNLESDRRNIADVLGYCDRGIAFLGRTKMSAYQHRTGAISRSTYFQQLVNDLPNLYSYRTFFMDPAAFNSMSAGGLVSLIASPELKSELSMYYEVLRQRLEDNNSLVDSEGQNYYHESYLLQNASSYPGLSTTGRLSKQQDIAFYLSLPMVQTRAVSDRFVIDTDNLLQRVAGYRALLLRLQEQNKKLEMLIRQSL